MTDFAELVMTTNTRGLKDGERALDDLVGTGERTEQRTRQQTDRMGRSYRSFAVTAGRALGGLVAGIGAYQIAAQSLASARTFDAALAETSTLIDGTEAQMNMLSESARELAREFGTDATQQVEAFYQAISAGAATVEDATVVLDQANKLAEGGITSVSTAVGILSGVVNSYGQDVITAEEVSDALFVGMRAGVTTIDQLSSNIGAVIPLANALGISFDETVAAVAALTKNNLTTSASVTALNAALTAVSGPTTQATELAESLGLEFNAAALQADGFAQFMENVKEATGGNVEQMRTLFGSVEGMKAALLLAGEAGDQFADIMGDMENKLGQTDAAVAKINASLSERMDDSLARLGVLATEFGNALLVVVVPALEAFVGGLEVLAGSMDTVIVGMSFLVGSQIPGIVSGLAAAASGASILTGAMTVLRGALLLVGGPIGLLVGLTASAAAYFLLMRDDANEAETALYDAAAGTEALNLALGNFHATNAPSAGRAAIDLANDNYALAESARDAAAAEIAKGRAILAAAQEGRGAPNSQFAREQMGADMIASGSAALEAAEAALSQARSDRNRAARTVTGSDFQGATTNPTLQTPDLVVPDISSLLGAGFGGGGGGGGGGSIADTADEIGDLNDAMLAGADATDRYNESLQNVQTSPLVDGLTDISDALIDAAIKGDNLLQTFVMMLGEMALEAAKADIGGLISQAFGGGPAGPSKGLFGLGVGFLAKGGGADPSKSYVVGEDGPEIFRPDTFGTVIPTDQSSRIMSGMQNPQTPAPIFEPKIELVTINDPRNIDEYRTSPQGERARKRANERLR